MSRLSWIANTFYAVTGGLIFVISDVLSIYRYEIQELFFVNYHWITLSTYHLSLILIVSGLLKIK